MSCTISVIWIHWDLLFTGATNHLFCWMLHLNLKICYFLVGVLSSSNLNLYISLILSTFLWLTEKYWNCQYNCRFVCFILTYLNFSFVIRCIYLALLFLLDELSPLSMWQTPLYPWKYSLLWNLNIWILI